MSKLAKAGWALAAFTILVMGFVAYMNDGMGGLNGYFFGVLFGAQWAWTLKGVK